MTSFLFLILTLRKLRASQRCEDKSPRRAQGHPSGHSRECSHGAILWERRSPRRLSQRAACAIALRGGTHVRGREGAAAPEGTVRPTQRCPPPPRLATKLLQAGPGSRWRHRRPLGCRDALRGAGLQRCWAATLVQSPRPRPARPALHLCSRHRSGQVTSTAHDFSPLTTVPAASPDHKEISFPDGLHTIKSGEADVRSTADPAAFAPPGWADPQSLS